MQNSCFIISLLHASTCFEHYVLIIIIIGTTAPFEPRPSSEASASCPSSLQHSSNFSPPNSWHNDFDLYKDKTFHEPIFRSLNRFIGSRISDSPAITSLGFVTIFFPEQVVNLTSNTQQSCVFIIRRSKLYYTATGIIKPVGGRLMHRCAPDGHLQSATIPYAV